MNHAKKTLIKISGILANLESVELFISSIMFILGSSFMVELLKAFQEGFEENGIGTTIDADPTGVGVAIIIVIGVVLLAFAVFALTGGILLLQSVSDPNKFAAKRKRFITGSVFTIITTTPVSIASILLYVAFGLKDPVAAPAAPAPAQAESEQNVVDVKPEEPQAQTNSNSGQIKTQMEILREMKERGEISNDEFKQMMLDLIKKG